MKITQEIWAAHEKLSKCSRRFLEFACRNPESLKSESFRKLETNDRSLTLQPWPTFVNRQTKNEMQKASIEIFNLIKSIPERIFSFNRKKMCDYYGISPDLVNFFLDGVDNEDIENLLARGDFIVGAEGLKCLEYNINTNLGGMQVPLWEVLYLNTPIIAKFIKTNHVEIRNVNVVTALLEHLLGAALKRFIGEEEINIASALPATVTGQSRAAAEIYYNSIYRAILKRLGNLEGKVYACEYSQLKVEGGFVRCHDKKVHSIVEWYQGFVPVDILSIFRKKNVLIYNGFITWLLSTKLNLALLSELEGSELFTREERATIKRYIPWTRKIVNGESTYKGYKIELKSFILANREKLVLKPLLGYGGSDVFIGRYTAGSKWKEVVEMALESENWRHLPIGKNVTEREWGEFIGKALSVKSWLVQEYVESDPYLFQWGEEGCAEHRAVWGFFVFGSKYAGACVRVLPTSHDRGIINANRGAKASVVFEVDD